MHNLHFIVVQAETAEDAVSEAEVMISDWGTENNWRSFGGCVSEDNEVYIVPSTDTWGNSRWKPEPNHTIEMINKQVEGWLEPDKYTKDQFDKCVNGDIESPFSWYGAKRYCEHMYQRASHGKDTFDVLQDEFFDWHFNECGVTHQYVSQQENDDPTNKKYVVFVDMHD